MHSIFNETNKIGEFGRTGYFETRTGRVLTPTFMPDGTRGAVKGLTPQQVVDTGVQVVLANTYHLHLQPGESVVKALGGLHTFANRKGPMLTDSGGFQVFSLGEHTKVTEDGVHFKDPKTGDKRFLSPEISIQIQLDLGADMIVAFDHLVGLGHTVSDREVQEAFERTHRWLERCIIEFKRLTNGMSLKQRPLLFGVVQGGLNLELRKRSLAIVQESDVDGIAIGGLSVGETREEMTTVLETLAPLYRADKPRFLLGVGTPEDLKVAVDNGIDMLDCVLPTRNARHATVWIENNEKIHLTNERFAADKTVVQPGCDCYTCVNGFSKGFLRHQFRVGEPLAGSLATIHNLRYMSRLCESYRSNIAEKT